MNSAVAGEFTQTAPRTMGNEKQTLRSSDRKLKAEHSESRERSKGARILLMVKNPPKLKRFEDDLVCNPEPNLQENIKVVNALWRQAKRAGAFPPKNKLEDIEIDIRFAKAINGVR